MNIITREKWGASRPLPRSIGPTSKLVLHHTVGRYRGAAGTRAIDRFHAEGRGWYYGYAYNFGVDPESLEVFEGRGAMRRGGHTKGHNTTSQAIVVYGDYRVDPVDGRLLARLAELVHWGAGQGWWPNRFTHGHKDLGSTSCPGFNLYTAIDDINERAARLGTPPPAPEPLGRNHIAMLGLRPGDEDRNSDKSPVMYLQACLREVVGRRDVNIDGVYGPVTTDAVKEFQRSKGLGESGQMNWHTTFLLEQAFAAQYGPKAPAGGHTHEATVTLR